MNCVALLGRLTADPELKETRDSCYTRFTLAITRSGSDGEADFISCVAFGKTAELICRYVSKGRQLAVLGRIQTGSYINQDGQKIYTTDVIVTSMTFCGSGAGQGDRPAERGEERRPAPAPDRTYGGRQDQRQDDQPVSERTKRRHEAERRMNERRRQYAEAPEGFIPERDGFNDLPFT